MADNTTLNAGAGGDVIATDDIAGVKHQRVKVEIGADGAASDVHAGNPMPVRIGDGTDQVGVTAAGALQVDGSAVTQPVSIAAPIPVTDNGGSLTVDGSVTIGAALPAGTNNIGDVDVASIAAGDNTIGRVKITDGTDLASVTAAGRLEVDGSGVTQPVSGTVTVQDGGGSLTVDGTVAVSGTVPVSDAGGSLTVDGTVTVADGGGSLTVDAPVGTPLNVQVGDGTNTATVRNLASNDALNVAIVDGSGNHVTSFGGGSQYAEDAAHVSGDIGTMALAVRKDAGATIAGADGDYTPLQVDASGNLRVNIAAGGGSGGTSATDEAAYTPASSAGTPIMGAADETTPDAAAEGTLAIIRSTLNRALHVNLRDATGAEVSVGGGTQYDEDTASTAAEKLTMAGVVRSDTASTKVSTDGDRTVLLVDANGRLHTNGSGVTQPISAASLPLPTGASTLAEQQTQTTALQLLDDAVSTTAAAVPAKGFQVTGSDGTNARALKTDAAGELQVDVLTMPTVTVADGGGSLTVDGSVSLAAAIPAGTNNIGDVDVLSVPAPLNVTGGGAEAAALRVTIANDSTGVVSIDDNGGSLTVDGTVAVSGTVTVAQATAANLNAEVQGDAANDAPVTGNPVLVGGRASAAAPTDVSADGDAVSAWRLRNGAAATVLTAAGALIGGDATNGLDVDVTRLPALPAGTNNIGDVDVLTVPAPLNVTGGGVEASALRVTIASDSTGVVSIDDNGGSVTVDGTVGISGTVTVAGVDAHDAAVSANPLVAGARASDAVPTAVSADGDAVRVWADRRGAQKIAVVDDAGDSAMDGTNNALRVNVVAGGSGDGAILDGASSSIKATVLDYTNSNPIAVRLTDTNGDYVSAGGGTQYTEDVAAAGDPVGNALIARRRDALSTETTTDGDNTALNSTGKGELYVKHVDAIPVTDNGGTLTIDAASLPLPTGASTLAEQQTQTTALQLLDDVVATDGAAALTKAYQVAGTDGTNAQILSTNATGHVNIADGGNSITVDGSVSLAAALPAGTNNIGDVDILTVPAPLSTSGGGTEATALRVTIASDSTGVVSVDDNGASLTVDGTVTAANAAGDTAHDAADTGNPIKVGYKAANALPTAVANNDRANAISDLWGRQMVTHIDPAQQLHKAVNFTTTQTGTDVITPTSGKKLAITSVVVGSYATTTGRLILWFGDNADTTYTAGTDQVLLAASFAPGTSSKPGLVYTPAVPVFCATADRELHITTDAGLSVDVQVEYYEW